MDDYEDMDQWGEISGSDSHDNDSEGSDDFGDHGDELMADGTNHGTQPGATLHADEIDGIVESQILGDFDRKMKEIQLSNSKTQSLGNDWDFTIADYDPDNFDLQDELRQATGIGKRKGKGRARGPRQVQLSQEVNHFLGQAHSAYASGDRDTAIKLLQNVITIEPGVSNAWGTLAFCYEDVGDTSRALKLRIMAAHLEGDADQWVELGLKSREIGSMEQAVYCYRNAARLDKTNPDILWDYAFCLRESGQTQKAIKTYESILQILPHDLTVLAQLRGLLVQTGDLTRAKEYYSAAFEHYITSTPQRTLPEVSTDMVIDPLLAPITLPSIVDIANIFGTREIATLADLLSGLGEHARAVEVVIRGAEWLGQVPKGADEVALGEAFDVNLRMRLAVAKLRLGVIDEGKNHAHIILAHDMNEYYELHTELADVFYEIGLYEDAVVIYERLACQPHTSSLHVLNQIGSCHKQMKNYTAARDVYRRIIDVDPDEHDAKMKLAEIYDILNEKRLALDLVNEVIKAREQAQLHTPTSGAQSPAEASLFVERAPTTSTATIKKPINKPTLTPAEAQRMERERVDTVIRGFKKLKEVDPGEICPSDEATVEGGWGEWLSVADELARIFMAEKKLFISDRYKEFSGLKRQSRRGKTDDADAPVPRTAIAASDYLKISLTEWQSFLIQYAFVITRHKGRYVEARDMLNKLSLSNAYQEWKKQNTIWFALLAIAVQERHAKDIIEYARKLITRHQFSNDALRLLLASLGGGITAAEAFVDSALQKYFFREMVQFERAAKGEPAVFVGGGRNRWDFAGGKGGHEEDDGDGAGPSTKGSSTSAGPNVSNPHPVLPTKESPTYVTAYGQISMGTRSYQSAIYYLLKAYDMAPNDPVVCLSLGAACIGRAMQRQADNRNHMVTQGFAFLSKYRSLRAGEGPLKAEEVDYNLGRGFQQLGLQAFAQKHYQVVLESVEKRQKVDPNAPFGVAKETAYNLSLIYVVSGSARLAQDLYRRWLSL
ncbi:TPR-2 domain protein [Rhizoctonia solani AG-3 Rhs1AP]|uniref:TPR-2 domain protein n=2 Tax=Rhizoctonia solani AG-3 TaxID=1086053 RepID=A0A074RWZ3_9AGAM|nr:TPR-2 domain protein [Rhizoctonia solani AG-3 Rhs1AP]KEP49810.1 TPR-2 domain protein [Rhizoctonia solani 123E]